MYEKEAYGSGIDDILPLFPQIPLHTLILPSHFFLLFLFPQFCFLLFTTVIVVVHNFVNSISILSLVNFP